MSKPLSTERRDQIVWQNADDAVGVANMLNVTDQDGRNVIARMISEGQTGELKAASFNGSGGGSVTPDPTGIAGSDHAAWERAETEVTEDGKKKRLGRPDPALVARVNLAEVDALLQEIAYRYGRISRLLSAHMPRVPKLSEVEQTDLEEVNADPGCESCSRITTAGGQKLWSKTWRTGRVTTKPKNADKRDKGRARRALLTSEDDDAEANARLCVAYRLCRGCYEHVLNTVSPGAGLTIAQAYKLSALRDRLAKLAKAS